MQALRVITAFFTCLHPTGGKPGDSASYRGLEFFSYQTLIAKIESGNRLFVDTRHYSKTTSRIVKTLREEAAKAGFTVHPFA